MCYDTIILTAANQAQAEGYREQLNWRKACGLLDAHTETLVIPDPGDRRVGSLGATLNVLSVLATKYYQRHNPTTLIECFNKRRILICHSGGDSRRTPAYAAQGKIFTPMPCTGHDGQPLALFDLILQTTRALPAPTHGNIVITSGDVLLTFDHASVDLTHPGVTGIAYFGAIERGARHGVYVPNGFGANPQRTECLPVLNFLQKPTEAEARAAGAIDHLGHLAIDTGLLSLDPSTCAHLLEIAAWCPPTPKKAHSGLLSQILKGSAPPLDLYEDFTLALAPHVDKPRYLQRFATPQPLPPKAQKLVGDLYDALRQTPFQVNIVPYCDFFHIGSSRELLNGFSGISRTAQTYHFANGSGAHTAPGDSDLNQAFIFNSNLHHPLRAGHAVIEASHASAKMRLELAGDNILTGLPPTAQGSLTLPTGTGVAFLPIGQREWCVIAYGLDDDFKTPFLPNPLECQQAAPCLFLNQPIAEILTRLNLPLPAVWPHSSRDGLWSAELWRVGHLPTLLREAQLFLNSADPTTAVALPTPRPPRAHKRYSLATLLPQVNHTRLLALRHEIRREVNLLKVAQRILANDTLAAATICDEIKNRAEATVVLRQLSDLLQAQALDKPLLAARVLSLAALIQDTFYSAKGRAATPPPLPFDNPQGAAFACVAKSVAVSFQPSATPRPTAILHDQAVWVTTPVRIDFAGGWSDTPPICTERGGTVLNAAVTLNGQYPVQVIAKLNSLYTIRLASIDLGERLEISTTAQLLDHHNPHDWSALAKAALILAGFAPAQKSSSLTKWLKAMGGGLDLTIFSSLPKGSGMGTSSILGAAVIACLDRVLGLPQNTDRLIHMTSILEQRMSTGGGWQDQVGGILPGVKLIRTQPGPDQSVALRWSTFDLSLGHKFSECCLLYFTGQKRLARNILQNVVRGYLTRDPTVLQTVSELKRSAEATKDALDAQDFEGFARGVNHYWQLKKQIDPGSTNAPIEALLNSVKEHTLAALLPGAGGGGFIFIIAKDQAAAQQIRHQFNAAPPNAQARFFDFSIDRQGLKVTIL